MLRSVCFGRVRSEAGYTIKIRIGSRYIEYQEDDHRCKVMAEPLVRTRGVVVANPVRVYQEENGLKVTAEPLVQPGVAVPSPAYFSNRMRVSWEPPYAGESIPVEKKEQIIRRVTEALAFKGIPFTLLHG